MHALLNALAEIAGRPRALRQARARWAQGVAPGKAPAVFYGRDHVPGRGELAQGGIVKCQDLQDLFPNTPSGANTVYLVSSALPPAADILVREARRAGARFVLNQNGVAYRAWYGPGWRTPNRLMRRVLRQADHVVYQSRFCKESADRYIGPCSCPSEILHNPVDTERFCPAAGGPPAGRGPILLAAGSHVQAYRIVSVLEAFPHVLAQLPEATLVLAGHFGWAATEDAAEREVRDRCRALGIADRVQIRRRYTQDEALGLFRGAHVLMHTKYNDPCPRLVVEALACGLPVVYSATGGVPELVGDEAGAGVPGPLDWEALHPPDPHQLASAVARVWGDYARFSAAARRRAAEHLDVRPWLARHAELFEGLLA